MKHKVGIIGCGFVGTAVSTGFETIFGSGRMQILEHDKFKPTDSLETVVSKSEILFVCLPTPMNFETGECDLSIVEGEVDNIVKTAKRKKIIVLKSTIPPGTTARLQEKYPKHSFVFNPEFLREKTFIQDFLDQDRIILGFQSGQDVQKLRDLYDDFTLFQKRPGDIVTCSPSTAEMAKYIGNCFLATKVMFFNEIYEICQASKIDFDAAAALAAMDTRIGNSHIRVPGHDKQKGFGGSCFPKDLNSLIYFAKENDVDPMVLETVWTKNLLVRENYEWEKLAQVNGQYKKNE